jgi:hypothetical protein
MHEYNSGWSKLDKYYTLTSHSPAYTAALVLNPAFEWEYIEKTWAKYWIPQARESVAGLWKSKYRLTTFRQVPDTLVTIKNDHFSQWKAGKHATRYILYWPTVDVSNSLERQRQTVTHMVDIYNFLLITTLTMSVSGGSYQSKRETIQTSHEWPLIYSQFLQWQPQLNRSFPL